MRLDNSNNKLNFSVIILAGGNSSRMKFPKPWLKINSTTFLEKIIKTYRNFGIENIIVVINKKYCVDEWDSNINRINKLVTIVENNKVEKGRLYSIQLGLQKLADAGFVYIQNVDNPFIDDKVLAALQNNINVEGVTVPTFNQKGAHPILINSAIQEYIINNFNPSSTLHDVINQFDKKKVEVENESILRNINTPEEYKKALHELV